MQRQREGGETQHEVRVLVIEGKGIAAYVDIAEKIKCAISTDTAPVIVVDATDVVQQQVHPIVTEVFAITKLDDMVHDFEFFESVPSKHERKQQQRDWRHQNRRR